MLTVWGIVMPLFILFGTIAVAFEIMLIVAIFTE